MKIFKTLASAVLCAGILLVPALSSVTHAQQIQVFEIKTMDQVKQDLTTHVDNFVAKVQDADGQRLLTELDASIAAVDQVTTDYKALTTRDDAALKAAAQSYLDAFEAMQASAASAGAHVEDALRGVQGSMQSLMFLEVTPDDETALNAQLARMADAAPGLKKAGDLQTAIYADAQPFYSTLVGSGEPQGNDTAVKALLQSFEAKLTAAVSE